MNVGNQQQQGGEVYFSLVEIRNFHITLYMLQVPQSKQFMLINSCKSHYCRITTIGHGDAHKFKSPYTTSWSPAWVLRNPAKGPRNHGPLWCTLMSRFCFSLPPPNGLKNKSDSYVFKIYIIFI